MYDNSDLRDTSLNVTYTTAYNENGLLTDIEVQWNDVVRILINFDINEIAYLFTSNFTDRRVNYFNQDK